MKKKFLKKLSTAVFATVLAATTIGSSIFASSFNSNAANDVSVSSILGEAINYGILANEVTGGGHYESTVATNTLSATSNTDVDLTAASDAYFIIGSLGTGADKIRLGRTSDTLKNVTVYTTTDLANKINKETGFNAELKTIVKTKDELNSHVNQLISNIQSQSDKLNSQAQNITINDDNLTTDTAGHYRLDLSGKGATTIYINVNDESTAFLKAIQNDGRLHITKDSETIVVFNINVTSDLKLYKYGVTLTGTNVEIMTNTNSSGEKTVHNSQVDKEIAQKIIWNIHSSGKNIGFYTTAGVFLIRDSSTTLTVEQSSAGWVATAGTFKSGSGEFHFVYQGNFVEPNFDTSKDDTSKDDTSKDDTSKDDTSKDDTSKDDTSKDDTSKDDSSKDDTSKDDTSKDDTSKDDTSKDDSSKDDTSKDDTSKDDTSKDDTSKDDTSKDDTSKDDTSKDDTSKDDTSKDDTSKDDSSKDDTSKDDTSKDDTSKDDTSKDDTSKDDTSKDDTSKDDTSKGNDSTNNNNGSTGGSSSGNNGSSNTGSNNNGSSNTGSSNSNNSNSSNTGTSSNQNSTNSSTLKRTGTVTIEDDDTPLASTFRTSSGLDSVPKTGISYVAFIWFAIMIVSGVGFMIFGVRNKKNQENQ